MVATPSRHRRRLAIVTQGLTTGGGVPSVTRWLRDGLAKVGYDVDVHDLATSSEDAFSRRIGKPGTWHRKSLRGQFDQEENAQFWGANAVELEPMRYFPRSELSRAIREYDVIQVVAGGPALGCAVIGAGPPVFLQIATRVRWERRSRRSTLSPSSRVWSDAMTAWATRLEAKALAAVDGVFVENSEMLAYARGVGQRNVCLAPPGVDTHRFHPRSDGWSASGYLLSVCRLAEPRKRLDRLILAYQDLRQENESTPNLVLAGRGRLPDDLWHLIDDLSLTSRIVVRNDVSAGDLPDLYRGASVYVQTSDEEGLGISVLEAMASGLPVVATGTAGARHCVLDKHTGYLVSLDHDESIAPSVAQQVRRILTSTGKEMADRGRERCQANFSTQRSLERFTSMYDRRLAV